MKALIILLFTLPLLACSKRSDVTFILSVGDSMATAPSVIPGDSVTYLALGDSYTYGVGVPQDDSYPFQLGAQLKNENFLAVPPVVIAFQGWTAGDLLAAIASKKINKKFDFVTILIGVNDENKGTDPKLYTMQLDNLLTEAITYANGYSNRVFVISIPDWWVTPFAAGMDTTKIRNDVTRFNEINQFESTRFGAQYVDITALSDQVAKDPTLTGIDGLHPTAKEYLLWATRLHGPVTSSFK